MSQNVMKREPNARVPYRIISNNILSYIPQMSLHQVLQPPKMHLIDTHTLILYSICNLNLARSLYAHNAKHSYGNLSRETTTQRTGWGVLCYDAGLVCRNELFCLANKVSLTAVLRNYALQDTLIFNMERFINHPSFMSEPITISMKVYHWCVCTCMILVDPLS
jgi:hypothetical protein